MHTEKTLSIAIFCLSLSIVISAVIIGNGLKTNGNYVNGGLSDMSQGINNVGNSIITSNNNEINRRNTMNLFTASSYLGISEGKLKQIISAKDSKIPYIKVGEDYIFTKGALDKWLETTRVEIN